MFKILLWLSFTHRTKIHATEYRNSRFYMLTTCLSPHLPPSLPPSLYSLVISPNIPYVSCCTYLIRHCPVLGKPSLFPFPIFLNSVYKGWVSLYETSFLNLWPGFKIYIALNMLLWLSFICMVQKTYCFLSSYPIILGLQHPFPKPLSFFWDSPTSVLAEAMQHPLPSTHIVIPSPLHTACTALAETPPDQPLPISRTKTILPCMHLFGVFKNPQFCWVLYWMKQRDKPSLSTSYLSFHLVTKAALMDWEQPKSLWISFICFMMVLNFLIIKG